MPHCRTRDTPGVGAQRKRRISLPLSRINCARCVVRRFFEALLIIGFYWIWVHLAGVIEMPFGGGRVAPVLVGGALEWGAVARRIADVEVDVHTLEAVECGCGEAVHHLFEPRTSFCGTGFVCEGIVRAKKQTARRTCAGGVGHRSPRRGGIRVVIRNALIAYCTHF